MYAITFELDTAVLKELYPSESWQNAYSDIKGVLESCGFTQQQGGVYFGNRDITVVQCVLAAQRLSQTYSWFKPTASNIKMLRIEELNDLAPAL